MTYTSNAASAILVGQISGLEPVILSPEGLLLTTLLDDLVPQYDVSSRHSIWIGASPALVYRTVRHADLARPTLVRLLMGVRVLPVWLATVLQRSPQVRSPVRGDCSVGAAGFTLIAEAPGKEFVLGIMGRFWTLTGGVVPTMAEQFREPPPVGLAQAFWNFHVSPRETGTELSTETRVRSGDEETKRQFARYWRVIRLGSSLIRTSMLRDIRKTAERKPGEEF